MIGVLLPVELRTSDAAAAVNRPSAGHACARLPTAAALLLQIATALPQRAVKSVWAAGTRMFHEGNYQVGSGGWVGYFGWVGQVGGLGQG
jgi:hypothetical protein